MKKRLVEILVLSDIHLGTFGCHARELLNYLSSVKPNMVILNGDIIDIWQFSKRYWPKSHMKVLKYFMDWITQGIPVYYITGNHDEMLRKFDNFSLGSLQIKNKLLLEKDDKKMWFFHGDVFDVTIQHSKWLVRMGSVGYSILILINRFVNYWLKALGGERVSLSKKIKNKVKGAVKFINNFEKIATEIAVDNEYDYVICGHIHHPEIKTYTHRNKDVVYMNSGDWVENLTALEYVDRRWSLFKYEEFESCYTNQNEQDSMKTVDKSSKELFGELLVEFNLLKKKTSV